MLLCLHRSRLTSLATLSLNSKPGAAHQHLNVYVYMRLFEFWLNMFVQMLFPAMDARCYSCVQCLHTVFMTDICQDKAHQVLPLALVSHIIPGLFCITGLRIGLMLSCWAQRSFSLFETCPEAVRT